MKIQSLSLVIPTKKCVNNCPFCVSKMHDNDYSDITSVWAQKEFDDAYIERLEYARENGVNTVILTGTGEALQNKAFLDKFGQWNKQIFRPFHVIELQTTGVFLNPDYEGLVRLNSLKNIVLKLFLYLCLTYSMMETI